MNDFSAHGQGDKFNEATLKRLQPDKTFLEKSFIGA